ncbi:kelch repeat and BTB domain-containing protein 12-like [Oculina patagonica]
MSSDEVNQWISSNEINVCAEENVFKIILAWIDHNRSEREKYFADLFRQVRLIYVSRDYLLNDIVTNDLVNDNACCIELVEAAVKATDTKNSKNVSFSPPRKPLETPVIVVRADKREEDEQLLCYAPRTNTWYKLSDFSPPMKQMVSCHGTLYTLLKSWTLERDYKLSRYDSFFDRWTDVPYKGKRDLQQIFVIDNNEDGIYALESENEISCPDCVSLHFCEKQHLSYITRYKPESNSWEDISSFDLGSRRDICIVAKDNFIYFIGGVRTGKVLTDVDRFDLSERKWEKLADLREARGHASGTAAHGKIFIVGGCSFRILEVRTTCEVYNETTNEWQLIASSSRRRSGNMMCVDDKVYVVEVFWIDKHDYQGGEIECYNPERDRWDVVTNIPTEYYEYGRKYFQTISCSMRVFMNSASIKHGKLLYRYDGMRLTAKSHDLLID